MSKITDSKIVDSLMTPLLLSFLVILTCGRINSLSGRSPSLDSAVFLSTGFHMKKGHVLYRDIWDMKPPVIHFINYFAAISGFDQLTVVRLVEKICLSLGTLSFFGIVWSFFRSKFLAFISCLFFLHYFTHERVLEGGNLTEEYASCFLLTGILGICLFLESFRSRWLLFSSGIFFSLAILTKEPFIISVLPWLLFLLNAEFKDKEQIRKLAFPLVLGFFIPFALFVAYFLNNDSLIYWYDNIVYSMNRNEVAMSTFWQRAPENLIFIKKFVFNNSSVGLSFFCMAVFGLLCAKETNRFHSAPIFLVFAFLSDYLGTMVSDKGFGHYYLQLIPSFVLLVSYGAYLVMSTIQTTSLKFSFSLLALIVVLGEYQSWFMTIASAKRDFVEMPGNEVAAFISRNSAESDYIWAPFSPYLYVESQRLSPERFHFYHKNMVFNTYLANGEQHLKKLAEGLSRRAPRFLIFSEDQRKILSAEIPGFDELMTRYSATELQDLYILQKRAVP